MDIPQIIVNFKLYPQAIGQKAIELAKIHQQVAEESGVKIAVAINALDVVAVAEAVSIPVLAQHLDAVEAGSYTGHILPERLKQAGVAGTLLNHAECQLDDDSLRAAIARAKDLGLWTVVCANTPERGVEIARMMPDLIAVEPPELIGGEISVSKADPGIIRSAVEQIGVGKVLVGAGIKDAEDVRIALQLGASGVLLASGVVKSEEPLAVLRDLVSAVPAR